MEPPDGGVAENVLRLALGLPRHGWQPYVAGPRDATTYPRLKEAGVPVVRLPLERGFGTPGADTAALRRLGAITRRASFDLVHAHSAKAGVVGRLAAALSGTPVLYSPHCFPFVGPWGLPRRVFALSVERSLGPLSDGILCVADEERQVAIDEHVAPARKLHVVHNGSPSCTLDLTPDEALAEFRGDGPLAACLTVLRPQKSVATFVDAAPRVLSEVPGVRLAVIGDGPLRGELESQAARLALDPERFRFFGFHPPAARQLRSVDLFVLPSAWEAFPISVLEAMACGVPQVATDVGGTSEALVEGETGLLCPPGDPAALAARLVELLSDPSRRDAMGAAARERHDTLFTVERMVERTAGVYRLVLAGSQGADSHEAARPSRSSSS
jgi:glycosyltransferase involved in cell wall biosynthesis